MREILLLLLVAFVAAGIVFGIIVLVTGRDRGLEPAEPDDRYRALPGDRPLLERDLAEMRFDTTVRGYRMAEVDRAVSRVSYDLGYKHELIAALEAEVEALRAGRTEEADLLRDRRQAAREPDRGQPAPPSGDQDGAPEPAGLSAEAWGSCDDTWPTSETSDGTDRAFDPAAEYGSDDPSDTASGTRSETDDASASGTDTPSADAGTSGTDAASGAAASGAAASEAVAEEPDSTNPDRTADGPTDGTVESRGTSHTGVTGQAFAPPR
ncbi:MAG: DivIVA domain-containing protein [Actinocatenispora sp.]